MAEEQVIITGDKVRILPSDWAIVNGWSGKEGEVVRPLPGIWFIVKVEGHELHVIDRELEKI